MLDDLAHEDRAERTVGCGFEVRDQVGLLDVESVATRVRDHVGVGIDAACLHPGFAQEPQQLATPTADVQNRRVLPQLLEVAPLPLANGLDVAAHPALEREVVGNRGRSRLGRDRCRRGRHTGRPSPFEPRESLLQLTD